MINQLMNQLSNTTNQKNINRTRWWSHDWLFIRFCLFWKKLQTNCRWFKQTKSFRWGSQIQIRMRIQQIIFTGIIKAAANKTRVLIYYILQQSKDTMLEFSKGTTKVLQLHINGWTHVKLLDTQLKKSKNYCHR